MSKSTTIIDVSKLKKQPLILDIDFSVVERQQLAEEFNVLEISDLKAHFEIQKWRDCGAIVAGDLAARLQQACGITLEPLTEKIDVTFEQKFLYLPEQLKQPVQGEVLEIAPDDQSPDYLDSPFLDLTQIIREQLALNIEPYPRKEGAVFNGSLTSPDTQTNNPFAVLKQVVQKK
jgi:uncharacterized metal-binding protein YceD (DUF177 family)